MGAAEGKRIIDAHNLRRNQLADTNKQTADFLRIFSKNLKDSLGPQLAPALAIDKAAYKYGEDFPIYFDLVLTMPNEDSFILHCTAKEIAPGEFRVNDGSSQHAFYMAKDRAEDNSKTFAKVIDSFIARIKEYPDMDIVLE